MALSMLLSMFSMALLTNANDIELIPTCPIGSLEPVTTYVGPAEGGKPFTMNFTLKNTTDKPLSYIDPTSAATCRKPMIYKDVVPPFGQVVINQTQIAPKGKGELQGWFSLTIQQGDVKETLMVTYFVKLYLEYEPTPSLIISPRLRPGQSYTTFLRVNHRHMGQVVCLPPKVDCPWVKLDPVPGLFPEDAAFNVTITAPENLPERDPKIRLELLKPTKRTLEIPIELNLQKTESTAAK